MADVDIPDHLPEDLDAPPPGPPADPGTAPGEEPGQPPAPYRNLLVPLVVVPALIVMVLVVIVALFGAIAGDEASPAQNLDRMIHGTSNERDQAATLLVIQLNEHLEAIAAGEDPEWEIDATFLPDLRRAWEGADPEDVDFRFVYASLLAWLQDESGVPNLCSLLTLGDDLDPEAGIRFACLIVLGALGPQMDAEDRDYAIARVVPFLGSDDAGLRQAAAISLQALPSEVSLEALRGALRDGSLAVRGNAALALAAQGDPAGAEVLRELIDPATYEAERARDHRLWTQGENISESRQKALRALAGLGRGEDRDLLEEVARGDEDLNVRAVALDVLDDRRDGSG